MSDRNNQSDSTIVSRSSDYHPAAPEIQSPLSRLIVKIEVALMLAVVLALGARYYQTHREDTTPVKVAAAHSAQAILASLPADFGAESESSGLDGADPGKGEVLYMQTCTACHGQSLQGMPHQGVSLRDSKFVAATNDRKLVAFLKMGRKPADAKNTTGLLMPPRGGNPALDDDALADIVAFLRQVQKETNPNLQSQLTNTPITQSSTRPVATTADPKSTAAGTSD